MDAHRLACLLSLIALAWPCTGRAEPPGKLLVGPVRQEAGAGLLAGTGAAGIDVWVSHGAINRAESALYVYRWRGGELVHGHFHPLLRYPHLGLSLLDHGAAEVLTRNSFVLGLEESVGLQLRVGSAGGGFSAVLGAGLGLEGRWNVHLHVRGLSVRLPAGATAGLEGRYKRVEGFLAFGPVTELWPHRAPAFRFELTAGVGWTMPVPGPRKKGQPVPPGP